MERILARALGQDLAQLPEEEKRSLLSRLLARFAHEVRNPLSSLDVHVQLLEEDLRAGAPELMEKSAARFDIIHGELHRLENIVKQFLSLAGPSVLDLQQADPVLLLTHVRNLLGAEAKARDIEVSLDLAGELPLLRVDPGQITQALVNLVINGIQAVQRNGKVMLRARVNPDREALEITVHDTGPGFPADQASAMFEPFFTTKPDGSGLGLWIVKQIVSAHGGAVTAANDGGSVFTVWLPLAPGEKQPHG